MPSTSYYRVYVSMADLARCQAICTGYASCTAIAHGSQYNECFIGGCSGTLPFSGGFYPPPWVGSRSPDGWDQIPYRPGGWVLHQPPWSFGFDSQTRGARENRRTLC